LNVLGHNGDTLGVDSAQVSVLEETNQVGFSSFLQGSDGRTLEAEISLEVLGNLSDQTLEGKLSDQKLGRLLVLSDLTESDGTRLKAVRLLDTTGRRILASSLLGGLSGGLASRRFTSSLLGTSHCFLLLMLWTASKLIELLGGKNCCFIRAVLTLKGKKEVVVE
jgi:hypothetical protein